MSYRVCRCGWEGDAADKSCPDCGLDWFVAPTEYGGGSDDGE